MPSSMRCQACGHEIPLSPRDAGKRGRCPRCGGPIEAPSLEEIERPVRIADTTLEKSPDDPTVAAPALAPRRSEPRAPEAPPTDAAVASEVSRARADPRRRLGHFVLLSELGKGGMGVVYRAWDDRLRRVVALKTIRSEDEGVDGGAIARFRREAEAAARLSHPNIVRVFEAGEVEGRHYIAMEVVEGRSLEARLRPGEGGELRIALTKALEILRDVAQAVAYAHSQGVVHRDLKPQNILVDGADRPRVLDFGLASLKGAGTKLTKTGARMGTLAYMPPEQASGEHADERADVYSLGATLYQILAGRPPFDTGSEINAIVAILTKDPVRPGKLNPRAAGDLETICMKCLEKDPARRYQGADALALELDRYLRGDPIEARPPGALERLGRRLRKNKLAASLVSLALVLGVSAGAFALRAHSERLTSEARAKSDQEHKDARREAVSAILREVESGKTGQRASGREDAVVALAAALDSDTTPLVLSKLDDISSELAAVKRELLLSTARPTDDEERAGEKPIAGLETALDRWLGRTPSERPDEETLEVVRRSTQRLERRSARQRGPGVRAAAWRELLGLAQTQRLSAGRALLASVSCEALGRAVRGEPVRTALLRYFVAEEDEARATTAAIAIARSSADDAMRVYADGLQRFFGNVGRFENDVARELARLGIRISSRSAREDTLERAIALVAKGDTGEAIAVLSRIIEREPNNARAWNDRAIARENKGDLAGALVDYDRSIEIDPGNAGTFANRGHARAQNGDVQGGFEDCGRAIALDPASVDGWCNRGFARAKGGDLDGALADLGKAIELAPGRGKTWSDRGSVHLARGEVDAAIADYDRAIEIDRDDAGTFHNRATAYAARGDLERAIADFTKAIELDPRSTNDLCDRAKMRFRRGDMTGTIEDFSRALEVDPRCSPALRGRATAYQRIGKLEPGLADLSRAIEIDAKDVRAYSARALVRTNLRDLDGAIADASRAIELDPRDPAAYVARGTARTSKRETEGAIADFSRALELDPRQPKAWFGRARARETAGDRAAAIDDYSRALELNPKDAVALFERSALRLASSDADGALADASRCVELDGHFAGGWARRAHARRAKHDLDGALADAARALELDPRLPDAWLARGLVHADRGEREAARSDLERVLELEPAGIHAPSARKRLDEIKDD